MANKVNYDDFAKLDIRVGKVVEVNDFPEAKKPAYKLKIDFGSDIGIKSSSAQIMENYTKTSLHNKLVLAVVNFPEKQIGPFASEVLTLGVKDEKGEVVLVLPEKDVPLGSKIF